MRRPKKTAPASLAVFEVDSLSIRALAGLEEERAQLEIRTRSGELTLLLVPRRGRTIRVVDLRPRDKRRRGRAPLVTRGFDGDADRDGCA